MHARFILRIENTMDTLSYKTKSANANSVDKKWVVVDVTDMILGRAASKIAYILRGKHKPNFTPHVDCGDNVVVVNADKIRLSGNKWTDKEYIWHTGYPGGQRSLNARAMMERDPRRMMEKAVKNMLPKNRLGSQMFRNLYVYAGPDHKHDGQNPEKIDL